MRTAIISYSLSGHTKQVANAVGMLLDSRQSRILAPRVSRGGFTIFRWGMAAWMGWATPVSLEGPGTSDCDQVILAAPVWAGRVAVPMRSWLQQVPPLPARVGLILTGGAPTQPGKLFDSFAALAKARPVATLYVSEAMLTPVSLSACATAFCLQMAG